MKDFGGIKRASILLTFLLVLCMPICLAEEQTENSNTLQVAIGNIWNGYYFEYVDGSIIATGYGGLKDLPEAVRQIEPEEETKLFNMLDSMGELVRQNPLIEMWASYGVSLVYNDIEVNFSYGLAVNYKYDNVIEYFLEIAPQEIFEKGGKPKRYMLHFLTK